MCSRGRAGSRPRWCRRAPGRSPAPLAARGRRLPRRECWSWRPTKNRSNSRAWSSSAMPGPRIGDAPAECRRPWVEADADLDLAAVRRELEGVGHQVHECSLESLSVAEDVRSRAAGASISSVWPRWSASGRTADTIDEARSVRIEAPKLQTDGPGSESREVEDVADQSLHPLGVALDGRQHGRPLLVGRLRSRIEQEARARPDDRQRRPELMRDRREQVGPQPFDVLAGRRTHPRPRDRGRRPADRGWSARRSRSSPRATRTRPSDASSSSRSSATPSWRSAPRSANRRARSRALATGAIRRRAARLSGDPSATEDVTCAGYGASVVAIIATARVLRRGWASARTRSVDVLDLVEQVVGARARPPTTQPAQQNGRPTWNSARPAISTSQLAQMSGGRVGSGGASGYLVGAWIHARRTLGRSPEGPREHG